MFVVVPVLLVLGGSIPAAIRGGGPKVHNIDWSPRANPEGTLGGVNPYKPLVINLTDSVIFTYTKGKSDILTPHWLDYGDCGAGRASIYCDETGTIGSGNPKLSGDTVTCTFTVPKIYIVQGNISTLSTDTHGSDSGAQTYYFFSNITDATGEKTECWNGQKIEIRARFIDPTTTTSPPTPPPTPDPTNPPKEKVYSPTFNPEIDGNKGGRPAENVKPANPSGTPSPSGAGFVCLATLLALQ